MLKSKVANVWLILWTWKVDYPVVSFITLAYPSYHIFPLLEGGGAAAGDDEIQWCFSQVKGTIEDEVTDGMFQRVILKFLFSSPRFVFLFPWLLCSRHHIYSPI